MSTSTSSVINFYRAKYTRRFTTEYLPKLRRVPGVIESTVFKNFNNFKVIQR